MTVETWLHISLTTVTWFWTFTHSWKLKIFFLQVTFYKAPFDAVFTLFIYPITFVASFDYPDSTNLTGENT